MQGGIFDRSEGEFARHLPRYADDEEVTDTAVKDDLGRHPRIGTTEDYRKRVLSADRLGPPFLMVSLPLALARDVSPVSLEKLFESFLSIHRLESSLARAVM